MKEIDGAPSHSYCGIFIKKEKDRYYWAEEEYEEAEEDWETGTHSSEGYSPENEWTWQEIPKYLYDALNKF
ncbi:unnamed protein product, partial [marine sediment metagenome]